MGEGNEETEGTGTRNREGGWVDGEERGNGEQGRRVGNGRQEAAMQRTEDRDRPKGSLYAHGGRNGAGSKTELRQGGRSDGRSAGTTNRRVPGEFSECGPEYRKIVLNRPKNGLKCSNYRINAIFDG